MTRLNIDDRRERAIVTVADLALGPVGAARRLRASPPAALPGRILCLRLERIGDLLMAAPAITHLRALAPSASIDLVVGSWNAAVARAIPGVTRVDTLDAAWLARETAGLRLPALLKAARGWRDRRYDLAINFEPDIRTNLLLAASGARRLAGFSSGGGGPLLDVSLEYDVLAHTTDNDLSLVMAAVNGSAPAATNVTLDIPDAARAEAARLLAPVSAPLRVGVHAGGGRAIKQWPESRLGEVARRLMVDRRAALVLTGSDDDREHTDLVKRELPAGQILDLTGRVDLLTLAAVIHELDIFITGDTGPMHLASAVGTPIVAVFGPSDPIRYGPRGSRDRVVRVDLPCSPCNRIRLPPARCMGHTPDCLVQVTASQVLDAVLEVLATREQTDARVRSARV